MKKLLKHLIRKSPFYYRFRNWREKKRQAKRLVEWERNGKPIPPPHIVKQRTLRTYAERFGLRVLVETGTYYGDMLEEMKDSFDRLYSIELSIELYERAKERFKNVKQIELIHGNSGVELGKIIRKINQPALFWLDSHYSAGVTARGDKDTPIYEEIGHIFDGAEMGHVIIIDDARLFGTDAAYPSIEELSAFVKSKKADIEIAVQDDRIRITPK